MCVPLKNEDSTLEAVCAEIEAWMAADVTRWDCANHSKLAQTEYNFPDKRDKPAVHSKKDKDKRKKERLLKIILI